MKKFLVGLLLLVMLAVFTFSTSYADYLPQEVVVIATQISLRTSANSSSGRVMWVKNGAVLQVYGESSGWYSVMTDTGEKGYVQKCYVAEYNYIVFRDKVQIYATPYSEKRVGGDRSAYERYNVIGEYDNYYVINYNGGSGFVKKSDSVWTKAHLDQLNYYNWVYVNVNCNSPIYTGAGYDNGRNNWPNVATLKKGTEITLLAQEGQWYIFRYKDAIAYIYMGNVTFK